MKGMSVMGYLCRHGTGKGRMDHRLVRMTAPATVVAPATVAAPALGTVTATAMNIVAETDTDTETEAATATAIATVRQRCAQSDRHT